MHKMNLEERLGRDSDCPSEMVLDRFGWGELKGRENDRVAAHIQSCQDCRQRMELRSQGFAAFAELDPAALTERIQAKAPAREEPRRMSWRWPALGAAAAAAVLLLVLFLPGEQPATVTVKGSVKLTVVRDRAGVVEEAISGEIFHSGDRLRFKVDLAQDGQVMVVGAERSRRLYACFPADGSAKSQGVQAGSQQTLPGAVELDESIGEEWLHLVVCPRPFALAGLKAGENPGELAVPKGCVRSSFKMTKAVK